VSAAAAAGPAVSTATEAAIARTDTHTGTRRTTDLNALENSLEKTDLPTAQALDKTLGLRSGTRGITAKVADGYRYATFRFTGPVWRVRGAGRPCKRRGHWRSATRPLIPQGFPHPTRCTS
jgi:hypothetical protein